MLKRFKRLKFKRFKSWHGTSKGMRSRTFGAFKRFKTLNGLNVGAAQGTREMFKRVQTCEPEMFRHA